MFYLPNLRLNPSCWLCCPSHLLFPSFPSLPPTPTQEFHPQESASSALTQTSTLRHLAKEPALVLIKCKSSYQLLQQEVGSKDHLLWPFVHILSSSRGTHWGLSLPRKKQTPEEKSMSKKNSCSSRLWLGPRTQHLAVAREGHLYDASKATACVLSFTLSSFYLGHLPPCLTRHVSEHRRYLKWVLCLALESTSTQSLET